MIAMDGCDNALPSSVLSGIDIVRRTKSEPLACADSKRPLSPPPVLHFTCLFFPPSKPACSLRTTRMGIF